LKLLQGNALDCLKTLSDESVQCCVTSTPYWGLRDYGTEAQIWQDESPLCERHRWADAPSVGSALGTIGNNNNLNNRVNSSKVKGGQYCLQCNAWRGELGLEPTPEMFIKHLVQIFHEVKRVLRNDGTLWLNLGDTYAGSSQGWGQKEEHLSSIQRGNKGSLHTLQHAPVNYHIPGLKSKDLCGIPWRTALALQADGWYLRMDNIWYKPNCMPESVKDRPTRSHEYIFLLTKSDRYFYDADAVREPHKIESLNRAKHRWDGNRAAGKIQPSYANMKSKNMCHPLGRNKRSVWVINTRGFKGAHFATFPSEIPYTCIRAGSRPGDTVLDPFAGSGTTLEEAYLLRRNAVGIELKASYVTRIIVPRLCRLTNLEKEMQKLFGYPGGKWPIRHEIVNCFPKHTTYVDVFGGSASILITKEQSKGEVFNDKNELIINFFRVVKHRPAELAERARHWIHSRKLWEELRDGPPPTDEIEKAFRIWALLVDSFGSRGRNFGTAREAIRSVTHARIYLNLVADRFKDVHVECLDFAKCIKMYDAKDTLHYCDPPYRNTKGGNSNYDLLTDEQWVELRDTAKRIKGKFLLSSNADEFVVKLFKGFHIREIDVRVTLPRKKGDNFRKEVLISNYPLPKKVSTKTHRQPRAKYVGDSKAIHAKRSVRLITFDRVRV
jgi:site-specific DNA-adenine methylase/DNA modification methylase